MPEIQKIDDAYIDDVIKSSAVYNPNLDVTQGVRLRELIKLIRDRSEQKIEEIISTTSNEINNFDSLKVNLADVYDALDQVIAGKVLDARQGKVLNDLVTSISNKVLPAGGTINQILVKSSSQDFDTKWEDNLNGRNIPAGGTAGQVLAKVDGNDFNTGWKSLSDKADLVAGTVPFNQLPSALTTFVDISYANLITAINGNALKAGSLYRINDYQTVHFIPLVSPAVLNTGPIEPLITLALSGNKISPQAWSEMYPQDVIIYTTDNSKILGATKGCILRRVDMVLNNNVCNDFRNVKYRRWKLAPSWFNQSIAYAQYTTVQGPDGALYYLAKPGGFTAGNATVPSLTNDDWVQVFINNNYYYSRSGAATATVSITSNQNPSHPSPKFNVNASDFIDTVMFPNYGTGFSNVEINNGLGNLPNLVFFNDNQASIVRGLKIGPLETGAGDIAAYSTTFILSGNGRIADIEFKRGIAFSFVTLTGPCTNWVSEEYNYAVTVNCINISFCTFSAFYSVLRGVLYEVKGRRMEYLVSPMLFWDIYFPIGIGNLKFNTTSNAKGWSILNGLGKAILNDANGTIQSTTPDVVVDLPLNWKTFLGCTDITSNAAHGSSADLSTQINAAKNRSIVYAIEDPFVK